MNWNPSLSFQTEVGNQNNRRGWGQIALSHIWFWNRNQNLCPIGPLTWLTQPVVKYLCKWLCHKAAADIAVSVKLTAALLSYCMCVVCHRSDISPFPHIYKGMIAMLIRGPIWPHISWIETSWLTFSKDQMRLDYFSSPDRPNHGFGFKLPLNCLGRRWQEM